MREVHAASGALAKKRREPAFVIPPSHLHDIESTNKVPSIHRLYALALIYGRTLNELLSFFVRNSIVTLFRQSAICSVFRTSLNALKTTADLLLYRVYCEFRA